MLGPSRMQLVSDVSIDFRHRHLGEPMSRRRLMTLAPQRNSRAQPLHAALKCGSNRTVRTRTEPSLQLIRNEDPIEIERLILPQAAANTYR